MTPIDHVRKKISEDEGVAQKDSAGVYIPTADDTAVRLDTLKEILEMMEKHEPN